jgi:hypothetical protein
MDSEVLSLQDAPVEVLVLDLIHSEVLLGFGS